MDVNGLKIILRDKLDDYRYNHSLCVAEEAKRLALRYNEDSCKVYIAGLLHDITKNDSESEHLRNFERFGIILSDIEKGSQKLWHAISGAAYVNKVLNVSDADIVTAIRYHTTARANMSLMEKIIYLADFTSADRNYSDVDVMRKLVDISFDKAMIYSLSYTIKNLVSKGCPIHPDTLSAYNELTI